MPRFRLAAAALAVLGAAAIALTLVTTRPVEAGFGSAELNDLVAYVKGGHADNLRLQALAAIGKLEGAEDALDSIARGGDTRMAIYACTRLGRVKSSAAKGVLKALVTDTKAKTSTRVAAMTAIAVHWRSSSDLEWLKEKTESDSALSAHATWLERTVYGK